jgi:hypothetical protein
MHRERYKNPLVSTTNPHSNTPHCSVQSTSLTQTCNSRPSSLFLSLLSQSPSPLVVVVAPRLPRRLPSRPVSVTLGQFSAATAFSLLAILVSPPYSAYWASSSRTSTSSLALPAALSLSSAFLAILGNFSCYASVRVYAYLPPIALPKPCAARTTPSVST